MKFLIRYPVDTINLFLSDNILRDQQHGRFLVVSGLFLGLEEMHGKPTSCRPIPFSITHSTHTVLSPLLMSQSFSSFMWMQRMLHCLAKGHFCTGAYMFGIVQTWHLLCRSDSPSSCKSALRTQAFQDIFYSLSCWLCVRVCVCVCARARTRICLYECSHAHVYVANVIVKCFVLMLNAVNRALYNFYF